MIETPVKLLTVLQVSMSGIRVFVCLYLGLCCLILFAPAPQLQTVRIEVQGAQLSKID